MKSITINVTLPYGTIARMLVSACEGGSGNWLAHVDVHDVDDSVPLPAAAARDEIIGAQVRLYPRRGWPLYAVAPFTVWLRLELHTRGDGVFLIGFPELTAATRALAEQHPQIFGEVLAGTWTAEHADVFLQLAAFGKVRYPS